MIKKPLLWLILLFALTRLVNLNLLPMFSDEALYIEWGWRATHYPGQLFHSLQDAKQPFVMWFYGLGQILFPDPLWGSRIVSVLFGLLAMLGIYAVARELFDRRTAVISALLYIVIPFFVFFDRQAFVDSAVVAFSVWSFYFFLCLRHQLRFKYALFLGITLGLGFFTKTTSALFLLAFLALQTILSFRHKNTAVTHATLTIFTLITFLLTTSPLLLQPAYWLTVPTNSRWSFTLPELLHFPLVSWLQNLANNAEIAAVHLTPPLFILLLIGLWQLYKSPRPGAKLLLGWIFIPGLLYLLLLRSTDSVVFRYLTAFIPLALIPLALPLAKYPKFLLPLLALPALFSLVFIFQPISFFRLQTKFTHYSFLEGYVTGIDTGYQLNEIVKYLKDKTKQGPIFIGLAVHSFNPESGIWNYFRKDPNAVTSYLDAKTFPPGTLNQVECLSVDRPLYFVAKQNDTAGLEKFLGKITIITNPYNSDYSTIFTLKTPCTGPTLYLDSSRPVNH